MDGEAGTWRTHDIAPAPDIRITRQMPPLSPALEAAVGAAWENLNIDDEFFRSCFPRSPKARDLAPPFNFEWTKMGYLPSLAYTES